MVDRIGFDQISSELNLLCQQMLERGADKQEVRAVLTCQAAWVSVDALGVPLASTVFRVIANAIDDGEFTHIIDSDADEVPRRPLLTVIEGGGGSKL